MWSGVEQTEHGVRHQAGVGLGKSRLELAQYAHPHLHILALGPAYLPFGGGWQISEVAVLNPDEIRFTQREVKVEVDQTVQRRGWCGRDRW